MEHNKNPNHIDWDWMGILVEFPRPELGQPSPDGRCSIAKSRNTNSHLKFTPAFIRWDVHWNFPMPPFPAHSGCIRRSIHSHRLRFVVMVGHDAALAERKGPRAPPSGHNSRPLSRNFQV